MVGSRAMVRLRFSVFHFRVESISIAVPVEAI